jgi:hypothetical protein
MESFFPSNVLCPIFLFNELLIPIHYYITEVLNWGEFCPPSPSGNTGQCLEIFWLLQLEWELLVSSGGHEAIPP